MIYKNAPFTIPLTLTKFISMRMYEVMKATSLKFIIAMCLLVTVGCKSTPLKLNVEYIVKVPDKYGGGTAVIKIIER